MQKNTMNFELYVNVIKTYVIFFVACLEKTNEKQRNYCHKVSIFVIFLKEVEDYHLEGAHSGF